MTEGGKRSANYVSQGPKEEKQEQESVCVTDQLWMEREREQAEISH